MTKARHILILAAILSACLSGCSAEAKKARHLARADKNFKASEYEKARLDYMAVLRLDPKNITAFSELV